MVQASFGVPLLVAAKIKNESKKTLLSYRIGWSYVLRPFLWTQALCR